MFVANFCAALHRSCSFLMSLLGVLGSLGIEKVLFCTGHFCNLFNNGRLFCYALLTPIFQHSCLFNYSFQGICKRQANLLFQKRKYWRIKGDLLKIYCCFQRKEEIEVSVLFSFISCIYTFTQAHGRETIAQFAAMPISVSRKSPWTHLWPKIEL